MMKEIDFLPQWYQTNQRRKARFHSQYVLIGLLFGGVMFCSFIAGHVISKASADVTGLRKAFDRGVHQVNMAQDLDIKIAEMKHKKQIIDRIQQRTEITTILGELAFVMDQAIVVKKLELAEEFLVDEQTTNKGSAAVVKVVAVESNGEQPLPDEMVRQKITISGIAAGAPDVAMLISRMEGSMYFKTVNPIYSRNSKTNNQTVTEFEIQAYINDYTLENPVIKTETNP